VPCYIVTWHNMTWGNMSSNPLRALKLQISPSKKQCLFALSYYLVFLKTTNSYFAVITVSTCRLSLSRLWIHLLQVWIQISYSAVRPTQTKANVCSSCQYESRQADPSYWELDIEVVLENFPVAQRSGFV